MTGYVYVKDLKGHRGSYQELFSKIFGFRKLSGALISRDLIEMLTAPRAIFATIGINNSAQLLVIFLRAAIGRTSCAIWLGEPFEPNDKNSSIRKRDLWLFRILRRFKRVSLFSIYPFRTEDRRRRLVDDWIADPQLWDMACLSIDRDSFESSISKRIRSDFTGKPVIAFLGRGSDGKNYPSFVDFVIAKRTEIEAVSVGPIDEDCRPFAAKLRQAGGIVIDRFVDESELLSVYFAADYVWCVYSESYDRPSGIYGRAIALGVLPVVRAGSYLDRFSSEFGFDVQRVSLEGPANLWHGHIKATNAAHRADTRPKTLRQLEELRSDAINKLSLAMAWKPEHT